MSLVKYLTKAPSVDLTLKNVPGSQHELRSESKAALCVPG